MTVEGVTIPPLALPRWVPQRKWEVTTPPSCAARHVMTAKSGEATKLR